MLGEIVEVQWEKADGAPVASGDIIGSIEGFKAISDIYCAADGAFAGGNSALAADIELVSREPYEGGWLYEIRGEPDAKCLDVAGYRALLDSTIDRILEKQQAEGGRRPLHHGSPRQQRFPRAVDSCYFPRPVP